ncbi:MAG: hypothetical protein SOX11_11705 [Lachnospiraceae bacterium]|nr:hypothetical protein [Lachnospiraceae bacterium]MDY3223794.1 hypothetical protein [Lachnospiraceae bacterium]
MTKRKVFWSFVLAVVIVFGGLFLLKKNHKEQLPVLFYTYQEGSEGFYPYWADWDYSKGEISSADNPLKISMLPLSYQPDILYENQWFTQEPSPKTGRGVYIREGVTRHNFHVQIASLAEFVDISLACPDVISEEAWENAELLKADYDTVGKKLTLVMEIAPMDTAEKNTLLVGRTRLNDPDKVTWELFELDTENYFDFQLGNQIVTEGEWLYGVNGEHPVKHPVRISLKDGTVEKLEKLDETVRGLVADTGQEDKLISTRSVLPVGRCGERIIWGWTIVTAEGTEDLFCLFEDETLISAIHIQSDGIWEVYDSRRNVSKMNMDKVYQNEVYFPQ